MKKRVLIILMLAVVFMTGCSEGNDNGTADVIADNGGGNAQAETVNIDLSGGDSAFIGFEAELISLEVIRQGESMSLNFIGISLDIVLESKGITEFSKIELVVSDMDSNMDITEMAKSEAGVFLAWSESGEPETPFRVFPKDAGTANLLTRNVTEIIVTR